jgi:ornithine decarboxylase
MHAKMSTSAYLRGLRKTFPRLAKKHGTPLFIVSRTLLREQVARFRKLLPRVEPFYAVKANPNPHVLRVLAKAGLGFDVASATEIELALAAGATPDKLVYANTMKHTESIEFACRNKVNLMTFDSEYELTKIARHAPGTAVMVRIKVPNVGSVVELSLKFGADPSDAVTLLLKAARLGLKPVGVSFHVGSQCTHGDNYLEAFDLCKIVVNDALLKKLPLEIVDIGGGFPIRHFDSDEDWFAAMAPAIEMELRRLFDPSIRIIAEPGRALVGPACMLLTSVVGKSIRNNKHWYFLDDGVYGALSGIIFDHCKYQFEALKKGATQLTTLAGPTCDSLDIVSAAEELPELDCGDLVYAGSIGAYSLASATTFNGIPPAKPVLVP